MCFLSLIVILMINIFFVFYDEIPWIGQSSNVWGLFLAISAHVTM